MLKVISLLISPLGLLQTYHFLSNFLTFPHLLSSSLSYCTYVLFAPTWGIYFFLKNYNIFLNFMAMILAAYLRKNYSNYILTKTYVNKIFRWRQFIRTPYSIREYSTSPLGVQVYTNLHKFSILSVLD